LRTVLEDEDAHVHYADGKGDATLGAPKRLQQYHPYNLYHPKHRQCATIDEPLHPVLIPVRHEEIALGKARKEHYY